MAGKGGRRPGSGRKAHLEDKTVEEICRLASKTIKEALESKTLDLEFRAELAAKIFVKRMPQRIEGDLDHNHVLEMGRIKKGGKAVEFKIG